MATATYTPLATLTLASPQANITFSSISQSYRDLVIIGWLPSYPSNPRMTLLGDASANYNYVYLSGNGSTAATTSNTGASYFNFPQSGNNLNLMFQINIMDYSATDKHKSGSIRTNGSAVEFYTIRYANAAAITNFLIGIAAGSLPTGTVMTLYGIAA